MAQRLMVLKPVAPAVSTHGKATDLFFHSDTLSAALLSVLGQMGEPLDEGEDGGLAADPPFRVSSALPVLRGNAGKSEVFYPVPDICKTRDIRGLDRKIVKRILYADCFWLSAVLAGQLPDGGKVIAEEGSGLVVKGWPEKDNKTLLGLSPRLSLAVERRTGGPAEAMLFEITDILVVEPAFRIGVVVECDEKWWPRVKQAMRLLGLAGIGPKRTAGRGQFEVEEGEVALPEMGKGAFLLLSLYHPTPDEFNSGLLRGSWYRLVQRGGFVTSPGAMTLRRRRVTMIAEGALFGGPNAPKGDMVRVLDPLGDQAPGLRHPVYRDGRAVVVEVAFMAR